MLNIMIIAFAVTLIYFAETNRLSVTVKLLAVQGFLLFGIAIYEVSEHHSGTGHVIFVVAETLIFKALLVPYMLNKTLKNNGIGDEMKSSLPGYVSLFVVCTAMLAAFISGYGLHEEMLDVKYFAISITSMFTGMLLAVTRTKILSHIVGFLVFENGIFMLSLAVGGEMPMIVNTGILLDLITGIIILTVLVNRIGSMFDDFESDVLSKLKD